MKYLELFEKVFKIDMFTSFNYHMVNISVDNYLKRVYVRKNNREMMFCNDEWFRQNRSWYYLKDLINYEDK